MELKWTKDLSVGNVIIDDEHRNLISMTNDVIREIRTRNVPILLHAFELLEGWLYPHFTKEERIAQAVGFPFWRHKQAQQHSLQELRNLKNELASKEGIWCDNATDHYSDSLRRWMLDEHIAQLDMQMKPALQARSYDFWPGWTGDEASLSEGKRESAIACGCGCGCGHHPKTR